MNEFLSTTKKCRFELNVLPAKQTGLNYSWQPILSWKRWSEETRGTFFLQQICGQITENHKEKDEKQTKSASRVVGNFDSREPRAIGLAKDVMIFLLENHVTNLAHVR